MYLSIVHNKGKKFFLIRIQILDIMQVRITEMPLHILMYNPGSDPESSEEQITE